jgi:MinD superfamily P-loop ATPase
MTKEIERYTQEKNLLLVERIPFDKKVMEAVNSLKPITEFDDSTAKKAIEEMWRRMYGVIKEKAIQ